MKKKIAKVLRQTAEEKTIGQSISATRKLYRKFKKGWIENHKPKVFTKIKMSKRESRIAKNAA